jgi:hypothetical protein
MIFSFKMRYFPALYVVVKWPPQRVFIIPCVMGHPVVTHLGHRIWGPRIWDPEIGDTKIVDTDIVDPEIGDPEIEPRFGAMR